MLLNINGLSYKPCFTRFFIGIGLVTSSRERNGNKKEFENVEKKTHKKSSQLNPNKTKASGSTYPPPGILPVGVNVPHPVYMSFKLEIYQGQKKI